MTPVITTGYIIWCLIKKKTFGGGGVVVWWVSNTKKNPLVITSALTSWHPSVLTSSWHSLSRQLWHHDTTSWHPSVGANRAWCSSAHKHPKIIEKYREKCHDGCVEIVSFEWSRRNYNPSTFLLPYCRILEQCDHLQQREAGGFGGESTSWSVIGHRF